MWRLKRLADPHGILAPGVMLSRDPESHLTHLHTAPTVEAEVDRCIECGFCERVCPSRGLTTTPRQRIALRREMVRQPAGAPVLAALLADYDYDAVQTCAGDGTCEIACPVGINTGALMKRFRAALRTPAQNRVARSRSPCTGRSSRAGARAGLAVSGAATGLLGHGVLEGVTGALRRVVSRDLMPSWTREMPAAAKPLPATAREGAAAVYFSACVNRMFGAAPGAARRTRRCPRRWSPCRRARACRCGFPPTSPATAARRSGTRRVTRTPTPDAANRTAREPVALDRRRRAAGRLRRVVVLVRPRQRDRPLPDRREPRAARAADAARLDRLGARPAAAEADRSTGASAARCCIPSCSAQHLGLAKKLHAIAAALADEAVVPAAAACCGFAGDRGFLHPELTAVGDRRRGGRSRAAGLRRVPGQQPHLRNRPARGHRPRLRVVRVPARGGDAARRVDPAQPAAPAPGPG